jgi:hypothetical protein
MPLFKHCRPDQGKAIGILLAGSVLTNINQYMTKSLEIITEVIRNPKPPFRKVDNQPKKPLKHRYERRKIKEYLHIGDWMPNEAT